MVVHYVSVRPFEGEIHPDLIGSVDHCEFDLTNGYCIFSVVLNSPTEEELRNFRNKPKDFRLSIFDDVMYFTLKAGSLNWNEAPFSPHLSKQADVVNAIDIYSKELELLLIDSETGVVKYCESYALDKIMSAAIKISIEDALQQKFYRSEHFEHIQQLQSMMSSEQIAQLASARQILD